METYNITICEKTLSLKGDNHFDYIKSTASETANNPWDAAHHFLNNNTEKSINFDYIEPEIIVHSFEQRENNLLQKSSGSSYLQNWPAPPKMKDIFVWHLDSQFSELAEARNIVLTKANIKPQIKIAHIDTGYEPGHPALPKLLDPGVSFVKGEENQPAVDKLNSTLAEQQGHGNATMCLLAGGEVKLDDTGQQFEGYFGAIPFAQIIPIRICETVALIRSKAFVKAVEYAIDKGCEVISMSMAGAPTREWADVVNKAYEKGVVLVTAAGNSWQEGVKQVLPKTILYPARWERVIAATGVTAKHTPYVFDAPKYQLKTAGGETMQGNYGPLKVMNHALAAYTPNTTWATQPTSGNSYFSLDGGGTSSATPQIAAAAALWICYNRDKLNTLSGTDPATQWKKVEAVKFALFKSANKDYPEWQKFMGNGILKAAKALDIFPENDHLAKAKPAAVQWDGVLDLLGILLRLKAVDQDTEIRDSMFATEILQVIHLDPQLHFLLLHDEKEVWPEEEKIKAKECLVESPFVSETLRKTLLNQSNHNTMSNDQKTSEQIVENEKPIKNQINIQNHTGDIIINNYNENEKDKSAKDMIAEIHNYIAQGDLKTAIEKLLELTTIKSSKNLDDIRALAGRFNSLENDKMSGVISEGHASVEQAKIRKATLFYVDKIEMQTMK